MASHPSPTPRSGRRLGGRFRGLYSAQYTVLESGGLDFHLDFTASVVSVNSGVACTFNAAYYPLSRS